MFVRSELKNAAKSQIKGNIGILFLCGILVAIISAFTGIGMLLAPALTIGMIMIFINLTKGEKPRVGNLFDGFNVFGKALWLSIITGFFIFLWSMLFVIPGMIKAISYSMANYILAENPDMTAREALKESKRITNGHKMDLFILSLSFFWWFVLTGITFGIAGIYVGPYIASTQANAYIAIRDNAPKA